MSPNLDLLSHTLVFDIPILTLICHFTTLPTWNYLFMLFVYSWSVAIWNLESIFFKKNAKGAQHCGAICSLTFFWMIEDPVFHGNLVVALRCRPTLFEKHNMFIYGRLIVLFSCRGVATHNHKPRIRGKVQWDNVKESKPWHVHKLKELGCEVSLSFLFIFRNFHLQLQSNKIKQTGIL